MTRQYLPIIGLEIHVQLKTQSKMFCRCAADYFGVEPNTRTCPVCLGLPGALPTINAEAVKQTVRVGLALGCTIPPESKFDRKHYFYPDLVKGYQISQYDQPFCADGEVRLKIDDREKVIRIVRAHLEEDTAKSLHEVDPGTGEAYTLIDCNKSGVPLLEIVSHPDMHSVAEASAYARKIHQIVRYIGASDGDMEKGQLRFDLNISVGILDEGEKLQEQTLPCRHTPIVEVKNLNSFRALEKAIEFEVERQTRRYETTQELYEAGNKETRGWDDFKEVTVFQRSKEEAHDYRYFPEPDLPPLRLTAEQVDEWRATLPELPDAKEARFVATWELRPDDARLLAEDPDDAKWFEQAARDQSPATVQSLAKWLIQDVTYGLRERGETLKDTALKPAALLELVQLIAHGKLSGKLAKELIPELLAHGGEPSQLMKEKGLSLVSDRATLDRLAAEVVAAHPEVVAEIRNGKETAVMFLVGQVMKQSRGQADPPAVQACLRALLGLDHQE